MIPGIKATLVILGIFGIVALLLYSPMLVVGGICVLMIYLLWRDLYRFFSGQSRVNKLKQ